MFVFELKYDGSAEDAIRQIDDKGHLIPYSTPPTASSYIIGVNNDSQQRTIGERIVKEG